MSISGKFEFGGLSKWDRHGFCTCTDVSIDQALTSSMMQSFSSTLDMSLNHAVTKDYVCLKRSLNNMQRVLLCLILSADMIATLSAVTKKLCLFQKEVEQNVGCSCV